MYFVKKLQSCDDYMALGGVLQSEIEHAESALGVCFAKDYKEYLLQCGVATADGHEFTGICNSKRLNVVDVTLKQKRSVDSLPIGAYVIEETHIDDIVIWQVENGSIYQSKGIDSVVKIYNNLCQYMK